MNKIKRIILCLLFILLCIIVIPSLFYKDKKEETSETTEDNTNIMEENRTELTINVSGDGECIYDPGSNQGYRYGPSMLINEDGSIDAWFSRPGNNGSMWDYICYRHMDVDGNWGSEEIVLKPTSGGLDAHSVCDPGVIYFGGYYYIGYTGTIDGEGLRNQIFVARSKEPNGKYEKWNGSSWGGDPQPIIRYEGNYWGVGEISFVVDANDNDEVYCYYSYKDENEDSVRCSKVDVTEDWPSTIRYKCISFYKDPEECSSDIVYLKEKNMYLAFSIGKRMTEKSRLLVHYSIDGKRFEYYDKYKEAIMPNAHNMGISKHLNGHIELDDNLFICYAYSSDNKWGRWKTYFQGIDIE